MEKLMYYRAIIKRLLNEEAHYPLPTGDTEAIVIVDETHDQYQLLYLGWQPPRRVHALVLHLRLHNGKIWIEHDGTEAGIANALLAAGVPSEDIVLAFHPPEKRPLTGFAVA